MKYRPTRREDGEPQPTWFKCSEREPSRSGDYLVAMIDGEITLAHFGNEFDEPEDPFRWEDLDGNVMTSRYVTHWMPLPDHPFIHEHTARECRGPCARHMPQPPTPAAADGGGR